MSTTEIHPDQQIYPGSSNQVLGVNNAGTADEYKTLSGTTHEINIAYATGSITLSTPQAIDTTSSPTFAGETLTGNLAMGSNKITNLANGTASTDAVNYGQLKVLQTVYATSSGAATSTTSTSYVSTTMTGSITPASASNRILILSEGTLSLASTTLNLTASVTVFRGATDIGFAATGMFQGYNIISSASSSLYYPVTLLQIDSPGTTSPVTYTVKIKVNNASLTASYGSQSGTNQAMPMILMEVV